MMNETETQYILNEFPKIKLSYENIIYKKVYNADIYVATPKGKKCFAWFTLYNDRHVCFIMELNENKQVKTIYIVNVCFSKELCYGTGSIFYGTFFVHLNGKFFSIEDIFSYKGKTIEKDWGNKLIIIKDILKKDLKHISYNKSFVVFGLPLMSSNIEDITLQIKNVNYKIDCIQFRLFNRINNYLFITYKNFIESPNQKYKSVLKTNKDEVIDTVLVEEKVIHKDNEEILINNKQDKTVSNKEDKTVSKTLKPDKRTLYKKEYIFKVKPDIQNDIYHLYCINEEQKEEYYGLAYIPDYNCSVMMNTLFRNIKENVNLDALEESDDEEEFENDRVDRFVYLEKSYNMVCSYNYKFKKFYPIRVSHDNNIIHISQLKIL